MRLPRYLAVAAFRDPFGFKRSVAPIMAEAGLGLVFCAAGLQVYAQGPAPIVLPGDRGTILGPIFRQGGAMDRIVELDEIESGRVTAARGQALITEFWGDYIAFAANDHEVIVLRAPLSDLACCHTRHRGLLLLSSDIDLLARCGVAVDQPDWHEVACHLRTTGLRAPTTCISGIDELLWGNRMVVTMEEVRTEPAWSPWSFARAPRDEPAATLAARLRELTLSCVAAQVRDRDTIGAMLSGGLDSSILAACLTRAGPRLTCLNLPYGDANGDERSYARRVAAHLGVPLFEIEPEVDQVDIGRCDAIGLARPLARAFVQPARTAKHRLAASTGAGDVVDGSGGDSLFCSMQSAAPVADRLLRQGPGKGMVKTAIDMARLTGASLPQVLGLAWRRAFLRRRAYRWPIDDRLLSRDALARAAKPTHPWLKTPRGALPGAATHIANMIVVENLIEIADGPVAEWSPLMAQPLVEFCLSVPSWHWFDGGHNRALARQAFAELLPPEIVWRRDKGSPDGFLGEVFEANRKRLADLLIGGELDRAGLLDGEAILAALAPGLALRDYDYSRVLRIADVEAWARACRSTSAAASL
ncbi:asparagine synthase C-terminal domain-containing protein [Novosphingobium sp. G106]|uniref:asparagine synthase-related protein n=1 Tax=Novosphingobium sp. G106 TaxID=2849500 RepID=UPI001C2CFFB5|nr:asparagine synthase C-terminal domain-containing protein [Novosphingobium sp. G106]MBV1691392.1 asparagine synthase C-terminal domain-containing protein [Novosphingobium sp. G106]